MEEEYSILNDPKALYLISCVLGFFLIISCASIYRDYTREEEVDFNVDIIKPSSYVGWFKLGLIPNTESRIPRDSDIDTGVKLKSGDETYSMYESRTWETKDYGLVFVVRDN